MRICAKEKEIEMCALCKDYPCDKFDDLFKAYPALESDNDVLRKEGLSKWSEMQDNRKENGLTYSN